MRHAATPCAAPEQTPVLCEHAVLVLRAQLPHSRAPPQASAVGEGRRRQEGMHDGIQRWREAIAAFAAGGND